MNVKTPKQAAMEILTALLRQIELLEAQNELLEKAIQNRAEKAQSTIPP